MSLVRPLSSSWFNGAGRSFSVGSYGPYAPASTSSPVESDDDSMLTSGSGMEAYGSWSMRDWLDGRWHIQLFYMLLLLSINSFQICHTKIAVSPFLSRHTMGMPNGTSFRILFFRLVGPPHMTCRRYEEQTACPDRQFSLENMRCNSSHKVGYACLAI